MYEANPMSMLIEQAGGASTTGRVRILDIEPTDLHSTCPRGLLALKRSRFSDRLPQLIFLNAHSHLKRYAHESLPCQSFS